MCRFAVRARYISLEAFLGSLESVTSLLRFAPHQTFALMSDGFAYRSATVFGHARPAAWFTYPPASPHRSNDPTWYRNLHLLSITYAFRPRLRSRLTLGGRAFPRKP
ncbi:conserved hypothetical protein [Heliomicrobium modesticaldum Ice1]|uniref:Uncharacterized protein n=1 Tax=Heliobacterium modesticaldum (strain ATCC 51547 / Ice1) TaxID=498761 RepID=B0TIE6_HELMI|nr:conserved hypothetical protein [Heliomicrobium modesticaldum Ice1]